MAKAPANYVKLADETELIRDGLDNRIAKVGAHINTMLANVPERAAIMQAFERFANWQAQRYEVQARLDRYISLRDRPAESDNSEAPELSQSEGEAENEAESKGHGTRRRS